MAFPTTKVEISLAAADGPYTASPTWTDVTQWTRSISINRGRQSDFDHFTPGTAQVVLDNRDNRFTPFNLSGPYVSGGVSALTPRRQIRITADTGSGYVPVFRGYVSGWPVTWSQAGQDSTIALDCFDTVGLLGNTDLVVDWSYQVINALLPVHYWRLNEPEGSTTFADSGSYSTYARAMQQTGTGTFTSYPKLGLGLPSNAAFIPTTADYSTFAKGLPVTINGGTIAFWFVPTDTTSVYVTAWFNTFALQVQANSLTAGSLRVTTGDGGTAKAYNSDGTNYGVGIPHHFAVTMPFGAGSTPTIYIDGQLAPFTFYTNATYSFSGDQFKLKSGVFQEVACFDGVLTAAQVKQVYQAGQGLITETTASRATRILSSTSLAASRYQVTTSAEGTVSAAGNGGTVIAELQKVADSEGGDVYCDKAGVLQFTGRSYAYSQGSGATAATFTDTGAGLPYGTELQVSYDGDNLQNDVTIGTASGGSVRVTNAATTNGTASTTIDTYLSTVQDATSLASLTATSGSKVMPTVSPFEVSNANTLANWATVLSLELLSKVSLTRTPTSGTTFTQAMTINAITHQITPARWTTYLTGSARYVGYFVLDVSNLDSTDLIA